MAMGLTANAGAISPLPCPVGTSMTDKILPWLDKQDYPRFELQNF